MRKRTRPATVLLGWREWVSLPDLGIDRIKAKVDTGAHTSALHAIHIEPFEANGRSMVRFVVHPEQRSAARSVTCEAAVLAERVVRSSSGRAQHRYVIATTLVVAGVVHEIELTLTSRGEMGFRMLLGRQALLGSYVVDSARSFLGDRAIAVTLDGEGHGGAAPERPTRSLRRRRRARAAQ